MECPPHLHANPCQEPHPGAFLPTGGPALTGLLFFLIWAQLSLWSLGQRHFWKHRCQWRPQQLQASTATLPGKQARAPEGASKGHCWQGRSKWHLSSLFFSPGWHSCHVMPADTRRYTGVMRVLASSQSIQFLPSPPPPESSTVRETSHPGCNVNSAEGRSSHWAKAGVSWAGMGLIPPWQ